MSFALASFTCVFGPSFSQLDERMRTLEPESDKPNLFETKELIGELTTCEPAQGLTKEELPGGAQLFVFPDGVQMYPVPHGDEYHSFVFTDVMGERLYGFAYTSWFVMPDEVLGLARAEVGLTGPMPTAVYGPYALCVLSRYPFHRSFKSFLMQVCSIYKNTSEGRIEPESAVEVMTALQAATPANEEKDTNIVATTDQISFPKSDSIESGIFAMDDMESPTRKVTIAEADPSTSTPIVETLSEEEMAKQRAEYMELRRSRLSRGSVVRVSRLDDELMDFKNLNTQAVQRIRSRSLSVNMEKPVFTEIDIVFPAIVAESQQLPSVDVDFTELVSRLHCSVITLIYDALLTEQSILFLSRDYGLLTSCIESILCLLYPFEWPFVYIPVLPTCLKDYLDAPQPYIVGGAPALRDHCPEHILIVDFDTGAVKMPTTKQGAGRVLTKTPASSSVFQSLRIKTSSSTQTPTSEQLFNQTLLPSVLARKLRHSLVEYTNTVRETSNRKVDGDDRAFTPTLDDTFSLETQNALVGLYDHNLHDPFADSDTSDASEPMKMTSASSVDEEGDQKTKKQISSNEASVTVDKQAAAVSLSASDTLRCGFVDVAISLLSGYRFCLRNPADEDKKNGKQRTRSIGDDGLGLDDIFDSANFLLGCTPEFVEFLTVFVEGQTFQRFLQRELLSETFDFFDRRMLNTMHSDALKSGTYKTQRLHGEAWINEETSFLSHEWCVFKYALDGMTLRWNRALHKNNKTILKADSLVLVESRTDLVIPPTKKSNPTEFGLQIIVRAVNADKKEQPAGSPRSTTSRKLSTVIAEESVKEEAPPASSAMKSSESSSSIAAAVAATTPSRKPSKLFSSNSTVDSKKAKREATKARLAAKKKNSSTWSWSPSPSRGRRKSSIFGNDKPVKDEDAILFFDDSTARREFICSIRARTHVRNEYSLTILDETNRRRLATSSTMLQPETKKAIEALHVSITSSLSSPRHMDNEKRKANEQHPL